MSASTETVASVNENVTEKTVGSFEGSSIMKAVVGYVKQAPTWEYKIVSGATLGVWNTLFGILLIAGVSLAAFTFYSLAVVVVSGFVLATAFGQRNQSSSKHVEPFSKTAIDNMAEKFHRLSIATATRAREILFWQSPVDSAKYAAAFALAGFVASYISVAVAVFFYGNYYLTAKYIKIGYKQYVQPTTAPLVQKAQQMAKVYIEKVPMLAQLTSSLPSKKIL